MTRKPTQTPRLGDRDYEILQHVMRYHMTTREVLHRLFFADSEENAVTKVTSRLTLHQYLTHCELFPPRSYFVLGPQATRIFGFSPKKSKQLGSQAIIREYATLAYCCLSSEPRERLTVRELQKSRPQLLQSKLDSSHYYLDRDGDAVRLAYIRVDYGAPPDHIARKCREDIDQRYRHQGFKELIDSDRFLIAIVTGRDEKAAAIHEQLKRHTWKARFRIEVVPDLVQLIARYQSD